MEKVFQVCDAHDHKPIKGSSSLVPADYVMQKCGTHRCLHCPHAGSLFIFVAISLFFSKNIPEWINTL